MNLAIEFLAKMVDERSRHRFAPEKHLSQRTQRGKRARIERQHTSQRWGHLQMRDAVTDDLIGDRTCALVAMDDDLEAAGQGPQKFQHRDVEGNAGNGEPNPGFATDSSVHTPKEIDDVPVFDHHAFRLARGAGGVDDIGKIAAGGIGMDRLRPLEGNRWIGRIDDCEAIST